MIVEKTNLEGCYIFRPEVYNDSRGSFFESFNQQIFNNLIGKKINFVQDNQSFSKKGVLRGLHFQQGDYAQAKLVRVVKGSVLDVAVDLRYNSPTFGKHFSIELSEINNLQLFIPRGFAHGFVVLSDEAIFQYKCDNYYNQESEGGIIYNDSNLKIDWKTKKENLIISEKDLLLNSFNNQNFLF